MHKAQVIAHRQTYGVIFCDSLTSKKLSNDYAGLCDLNGFLYSTGISPNGRRWWLNLEASSV